MRSLREQQSSRAVTRGSRRSPLLLVDIGNSRIKWAACRGRRLGRQRAAAHTGWSEREFRRALFGSGSRYERVLVVSVARRSVVSAFVAATRAALRLEPQFVRSERARCGVRNGYREVWRLGADRWAALIGAYAGLRPGEAVCVVDVGTAITLDLLDEHGLHRGGAIVPGPELMVASLLADTGGIRRRAQDRSARAAARRATSPPNLFAKATGDAIRAGAVHAAASVIDRSAELGARALASRRHGAPASRRRRHHTPLLVLLTGGAAPAVRAALATRRVRAVPDLVLRGLAAIAGESRPARSRRGARSR